MVNAEAPRPNPEQWLREAQAEAGTRGRLKIFLGYSSGVGKSYRMLSEGRRRQERGQDVVVGAVQAQATAAAAAELARLETIPMRRVEGRAVMDVEAILRRRPQVCLVDGLAHENPAGCGHAHRWEEIEALLGAGIGVAASVNLQFIAERRAEVERITGREVSATVPLELLRSADEIELVDAPPQLLRPATGADGIRRGQLGALREIALLLAAEVVECQLERYLERHGLASGLGARERILVCVPAGGRAEAMLASARRNAARFRGELLVAQVVKPGRALRLAPGWAAELAAAGTAVMKLEGDDLVATLLEFARHRGITQLYVGHSAHLRWWRPWARSRLERLIATAAGLDIRIFPH